MTDAAILQPLLDAIGAVLDTDAAYDGANIVIPCKNHGDAIVRMFRARNALAIMRVPESEGVGA